MSDSRLEIEWHPRRPPMVIEGFAATLILFAIMFGGWIVAGVLAWMLRHP